MRKMTDLKRQFYLIAEEIRTQHVSDVTSYPFAPLFQVLQKREPLFDPDSGSRMEDLAAILEEDDEVVRFEKEDRSFSVIFSDHELPTLLLPLTNVLQIAGRYNPHLTQLMVLKDVLEHGKYQSYEQIKQLQPLTGEILALLQQAADQNSDFGLHLLGILLPDDAYFISPDLQCALYDVDSRIRLQPGLKVVRTMYRRGSTLGISFQDLFVLQIALPDQTFSQHDFPAILTVKRLFARPLCSLA